MKWIRASGAISNGEKTFFVEGKNKEWVFLKVKKPVKIDVKIDWEEIDEMD